MIRLPYAGLDSLGCDIVFETRMDVAALVSPPCSHVGRLTVKLHCNVSPMAALFTRYDRTGSDVSSASSFPASLRYSRNGGFVCGSSVHARADDVATMCSASQIKECGIFSETEGFSDHRISGLTFSEEKYHGTKGTVCLEPSFYDAKPSMDHSDGALSAGSNKSQPSLSSMLSTEENQNPLRQIPLCGTKAVMSHIELNPHPKLSKVTIEIENAKVPSVQSSEGTQEPSLNCVHWHESKSAIGAHVRQEYAKMHIKEDEHDPMDLKMYANAENKGFESSHHFHGSSGHAEDACTLEFLQSHASAHSHSFPDYPVLLKEMNQAREESINDTNSMSVVRLPVYCTSGNAEWSSQLTESVLYLDSLGVDSNRLLQEEPTIMTYDIKRLRELVRALECLGLQWKDLGRIFNLCPRIIHLCPVKDIKLVTSFLLEEVGLLRKDLGKVIRRCPRLLTCNVVEQLSPTLSFLHTLGFTNMGYAVANNAALLSMDVEKKLIPKLEYIENLGFTKREVVSIVNRFPALFNYNVKENLEPKYEYLVHQMGGSNRDLLAFPQYFGYSLRKRIIPRYQCMVKQDVSLSIQAMLTLSEAEFSARFQV